MPEIFMPVLGLGGANRNMREVVVGEHYGGGGREFIV